MRKHLGVLVLLKLAHGRVASELGLQERGSYIGLWHLGAAGSQPALAACGTHNGGGNRGEVRVVVWELNSSLLSNFSV